MKETVKMERIVIVGCAGCGKSTLAAKLGKKLDIPVLFLDTIYWKANWQEEDKEVFRNKQKEMIAKPKWILDGNYRDTLDMRLESCDTVFFLDYPRRVAVYGIFKRYFQYRNKPRESIAAGCCEKIDRSFFNWVWNFKKKARPHIVDKISKFENDKQVLVFKKRKHLNKFLKENNLY